jgi:hypothetical protein
MNDDLPEGFPPIVRNVLDRHGLVAVSRERYEKLLNPDTDPRACPYEMIPDRYSLPTHRKYVGTICDEPGDPLSGLHVVECTACGHVTFERPVAMA